MSPSAVVWLVVGLLTLAVTIAMLLALIRHFLILGRALGRFGDEVNPLAREITEQADRASSRTDRISRGRRSHPGIQR